MLTDQHISMKELAGLFGSTQKRIGLALERLGLWKVGGKPTPKAYQEGYVGRREYPGHEDYPLAVWHRDKTIAALQSIGLTLLPMFTANSSAGQMVNEDEDEDEDEVDHDEVFDGGCETEYFLRHNYDENEDEYYHDDRYD